MRPLSFRTPGLALAAGLLLLAACSAKEPGSPAPVAPEPATEATEAPDSHHEADEGDADHEHGEDEAAGGAPHVHGLASLAITREGNQLTGELISPMANFGLSEAEGVYTDVVTAELGGLVEIAGGACTASVPDASTDTSSGHADGVVRFSWTCTDPEAVTAIRFAGFLAFPAFETVEALYITDTEQKVGELTPASPELSLK